MPEILQLDIKKWPFLQELLDKEVEKEVGAYRRNVAKWAREKGRQEGRSEVIRACAQEALWTAPSLGHQTRCRALGRSGPGNDPRNPGRQEPQRPPRQVTLPTLAWKLLYNGKLP